MENLSVFIAISGLKFVLLSALLWEKVFNYMGKDFRIVIPCFRADATIKVCLESLFLSENIDFEVVVVDDGYNSSLPGLTALFPITIVTTSEKKGAASARNRGASGFKGKALIFIDADVKVEKQALSFLVAPILSGTADVTVGRYSDNVRGKKIFEVYKQLYLAYIYGGPKRELKNAFWTALSAVRTKYFIRANGFDSTFRGAGPEDIDLGIKLSKLNARILSTPEAAGEHLSSLNMTGLLFNDFRKGCEDVYIHWNKGVSITDNRHATIPSIAAVISAWSVVIILLFPISLKCYLLIIISFLYLYFRGALLIKGYFHAGLKIFIAAIPITFVLDLIRGISVIAGTVLACVESITKGSWKPFRQIN
jgi:glycosyltransferase involved in cell wall biosynthesis